ncbi:MerR family transcriptional regulator [Bacillus sp. RG28]|uniref:MerR family transcriptional regulator n=1 Tax=Gottfriedia endophytica TaxID=2820819 RepID=A0A940SI85_9BACI|nr:MerR family transcriptional regulator [Gottfriedia endophytica]MBP0724231.1 MerR family transcriptional regulator [Gottfriedia endophytica]
MTPIGKYNIKAISTIVGIQPGTLRAWERRYNIIKPVRNDAGHRLYTEEHVHILKWLIQKVNEGFTIGQAVNLFEAKGEVNSLDEPIQLSRTEGLINKIVTTLLRLDEIEAHKYVDEAFSLFTIEKVLYEVLLNVVKLIEDMSMNKQIRNSHEHFAFSFLKARIGMIYHNSPVNTSFPKTIVTCGPGENHDVRLMILATFIRRRGFQVIYIGTSLDIEEINYMLEQVSPSSLVLSCTRTEHLNETIQLAKDLKKQFPELKISLSGIDDLNETRDIQQFIIENSIECIEKWIEENLSF